MAELAREAVLVPSSSSEIPIDRLQPVSGPSQNDLQSVSTALQQYATMGYQASHFAQAVAICEKMLQAQPPSKAPPPLDGGCAIPVDEALTPEVRVQPTIFLGVTANLFGTGCREAIRFLCAECVPLPEGVEPAALPDEVVAPVVDDMSGIPTPSFASKALIHVLVVSGGAMEHDIRRACEPYRLLCENKDGKAPGERQHTQQQVPLEKGTTEARFGNVAYDCDNDQPPSSLFTAVMRRLVVRLVAVQQQRKAFSASQPIPPVYEDICSWTITPSMLWYVAGRWLPELFTEALAEVRAVQKEVVADEGMRRAESTVLYWAAKNDLPVFSPSFVDGDIMQFILEAGESAAPLLKLDLVPDIHRINRLAMRSRRTGIIVLGGGVVKHHVCNANLMRNGTDGAVFINNGQEFDGSDAGARPDEAVSWGKLRLDADFVKVYAEVSLVFPLLVAKVFLPRVRSARGLQSQRDR
ncbi:deoxyhypusine synthase [Trypanosoma grayi]|uniref:deoxyhypusine synthase n=1 Tax=Trypanosoma grayi TaxID=71804 RepID=UPI0004F44449|nr:deoxyhypusine synthase [Trypanosoma grayi]KEG15665.1 deoxyhypusine synthase [Trypanosoma grayi]